MRGPRGLDPLPRTGYSRHQMSAPAPISTVALTEEGWLTTSVMVAERTEHYNQHRNRACPFPPWITYGVATGRGGLY
eukprot:4883687-Pyramimonas_sp.AAC.1